MTPLARSFNRTHVSVAVDDLPTSIDEYTALLQHAPVTCQAGKAIFELLDPPLTLELVEDRSLAGQFLELGLDCSSEWLPLCREFDAVGLACDCREDHSWLEAPDDLPWIIHTKHPTGARP